MAKFSIKASGAALLSAALLIATAGAVAADTTVIVANEGDGGWMFNPDPNNQTPYEFTTEEASIGNGSIRIEPITNTVHGDADKFIAFLPLGIAASDFESISYDFLIDDSAGATIGDAAQFYLNVYVGLDSNETFYDCRYDVVPLTGDTETFTTQSFGDDDTATNVRSRNGAVCPPMLDALPDGAVINFITLNVGDTSGNDEDVGGYYDNVVLETGADTDVDTDVDTETTTYDFEASPATKDDCKHDGFADFGFSNQGQCVASVQANDNSGK